jgi:nucleolar protein 58
MSAYRSQLSDYLKNRMNVIAPNLTVMLGELVGYVYIYNCCGIVL